MSEAEASASGVLAGEAPAAPVEASEGSGNAAPWYGEIDDSLVGYIENKGWKSPGDAINGYANLEKLLGADRAGNTVVLPKEGDAEGWNEIYNRLGRPEKPDEYKIEGDDDRAQWFRDQAHAAGLNQEQASKLYGAWSEQEQAREQAQGEEIQAQQAADIESLKKDWGLQYEANVMAGRKAASRFGLDEEKLGSLEESLGTRGLLEFMSKIGRSMGEDSFESGASSGRGFGLTPQAAQAKIGELKGDKDFQAAYLDAGHPGHREAMEKMTRLAQAAYPEN